jgi:hypothetical protein
MASTTAALGAAACLAGAAFVAGIARLVRGGDAALVSGYSPGDLPPAEERVLTRRVGALGYAVAGYTALGAAIALLSLPDAAWLGWTAGYLLFVATAYAVDPRR